MSECDRCGDFVCEDCGSAAAVRTATVHQQAPADQQHPLDGRLVTLPWLALRLGLPEEWLGLLQEKGELPCLPIVSTASTELYFDVALVEKEIMRRAAGHPPSYSDSRPRQLQ